MRRTIWTAAAGTVVALALCACTAAHAERTSTPSPASSGSTVTAVSIPPSPADTGPIAAGPTTTADGACPFLTLDRALDDAGERLGRVTVATSGGAPVGCTFYPATGALASSEHLPPPEVPVIDIAIRHYADDIAAHNAMVVASRVDPAAYSDSAPGVDEAVAFATRFYAADGDQDRAFAFRQGTTVVLVRLAQTTSFNAKHVGTDVAATLR